MPSWHPPILRFPKGVRPPPLPSIVIDEYWHDRTRNVCYDVAILAKCGFAKEITDKSVKEQILRYTKVCKDRLTELIIIVKNEGIEQIEEMKTLKVEESPVNYESEDYKWLARVQEVYAELKKRTWISIKDISDPMIRKQILDWLKVARDGLITIEKDLGVEK